jgi:hypothetical protein
LINLPKRNFSLNLSDLMPPTTIDLPSLPTDDLLTDDLSFHWLLIDPKCNLWKFVGIADKISENNINYTPIMSLHGFTATHKTWNNYYIYLWNAGYRYLFAYDGDDRKGIIQNAIDLDQAVKLMLKLTGAKFFDVLTHSMGGVVFRYYKHYLPFGEKIRLYVSTGSPQNGLIDSIETFGRLWVGDGAYEAGIKSQVMTDLNSLPEERLDLHKTAYINISGSLMKLGGTDGLFIPSKIPHMVNLSFSLTHFNVNKDIAVYDVIKKALSNQLSFFYLKLKEINLEGVSNYTLKIIFPIMESSIVIPFLSLDERSQKCPLSSELAGQTIYAGISEKINDKMTIELHQKIPEVKKRLNKTMDHILKSGLSIREILRSDYKDVVKKIDVNPEKLTELTLEFMLPKNSTEKISQTIILDFKEYGSLTVQYSAYQLDFLNQEHR